MNAAMREGRYSPELWKEFTGLSAPELWAEYVKTVFPEPKPIPAPAEKKGT
jgi:hypothetical protein